MPSVVFDHQPCVRNVCGKQQYGTDLCRRIRRYNIEDGHFELEDEPTDFLKEKIEEEGITLYPQFYKDFDQDKEPYGDVDATIRVFVIRDKVNLIAVKEGRMPETDDEIAIDFRHAGNNGITVGDKLSVGGKQMAVTGLVSFSDYSTLFKKNTDTMFDAITFDIGCVTQECFDKLDADTVWQYAYQHNVRPKTDEEKKEFSDDLIPKVAVLSVTGGYLDDEDEAEELSDNVDFWTDYLEDIQDKADDLQARGDDLQARADALEEEGKVLEAQGDDLQAEGDALTKEGETLQSDMQNTMTKVMTVLAQAGVPVSADMMGGAADGEIPAEVVAMLPENLQKEIKTLKDKAADLEKRGEDLKARGDELQAKADDLQARGDALQKEGDALQEEADAIEALQPTIDEYVDNLEALEPYEDNINKLTDFVPEYACQAIHFAPKDMKDDKGMCEVLLIVFVVVLAFIFAITASNTITNEAKVIGTLRASGYTRGELLRHYVSVPIILTIISAILGNIVGYTVLKNGVIWIYGRSYSLPPIKTYFDADAFIRTTIFPVVTVIVINVITVWIRLRIAPLKFLRGDLSVRKNKKAMRLPKFSFFARFRLRILGQNLPGYLVLFAGIFFVMVLLVFSVGMPYTLNKYMEKADKFAIADYQVVLKSIEDEDGNEITTKAESAEKFSMDTLSTVSGVRVGEEITVYGYSEDSKIFPLPYDLPKGKVYVSSDYAEKFKLAVGDTIELKAKYARDAYNFEVAGIQNLFGSLSIMMPNDVFNDVLGYDEGSFSGFISNDEITDIDDDYVAVVITRNDLMSMARQLSYSMGGMMDIFSYFCAAMAILIIYLLTKIIIENNAGSISMVKVLGYKTGEIGSLYVMLTSIVVVISAAATAALSYYFVAWIWRYVMYGMSGWFKFEMDFLPILKCVVMVLIAYVIVALIDLRRIRRVPLTEALKNVE